MTEAALAYFEKYIFCRVFTALSTMQIIKRTPGATGFHVRPRIWVVERSFAWINKHRRCVRDYATRPDHHEAMVHLAMITTMTRRLART